MENTLKIILFVFQDPNLTLYTHTPDLSDCFQQTVLLWVPAALLWICSVFYIPYLLSLPSLYGWRDKSKLNIMKMVRRYFFMYNVRKNRERTHCTRRDHYIEPVHTCEPVSQKSRKLVDIVDIMLCPFGNETVCVGKICFKLEHLKILIYFVIIRFVVPFC